MTMTIDDDADDGDAVMLTTKTMAMTTSRGPHTRQPGEELTVTLHDDDSLKIMNR